MTVQLMLMCLSPFGINTCTARQALHSCKRSFST